MQGITATRGFSNEDLDLLAYVLEEEGVEVDEVPLIQRREPEIEVPLSFAQQRLWFLEQLQPGNPVYHLPTAIRVTGPLNAAALEKTFAEIVRRHEILRTTFTTIAGSPQQVVAPSSAISIPLIDLRDFAIDERETESRRLINEEVLRPFDLSRGALLRTLILRLKDDEHIFVVTMHHIISDGWSSTVLVREIGALYEAFATGNSAMLEELPLQYADYTLWQRDWLQGEVLESQLDYWRKQLSNLQMLKLPLDHQRPLVQSFRGAKQTAEIRRPIYEALKELGRSEDATLFMVLLAAFGVLLSRYSGQNDITIGTPVANRRRTELESLIGLFVNTLVLRLDTTNCSSFRSLVRQAREVCLGAYAHQDVPFEKLVDELQPERSLSHTPLFQVVLVLQNLRQGSLNPQGLRLEQVSADAGAAKFDLTFVITEFEQGLGCTLEYNTDLFEAGTIARLLKQFQTLVEAAALNSDKPLAALPLLNAAEREELLAELSGTGVDCRRTESLIELFEDQVARTPQAVAVNFEDERLTYAELNIRANRLAHYLQEQGVGLEVPVALCLERSLEVVVAILGVLKAGGAYLPLDPTNPRERLAFMIDDAQASVLLTQQHLSPLVSDLVPTTLALDADEDLLVTQSEENPHGNATAANTAYIIYTSGSTGKSKGVLITHSNVTRLFASAARWFDFDANDVWTLFHSYAFDFSVWELWGALLYGGRLVVVPYQVSRAPETFYELLHREQVTVLNQTPSAFRQLIRVEESQTELPELRLRLIVFGGEALDPASLVPWIERHGDDQPQLINMYGITETTVHVTYRRIMRNDAEQAAGSLIGEQLPDLQLYALDQLLEPVPIGIAGELYVGGDGLARGYLRRPELTAERFLPNPFSMTPGARLYKTGDLARYVGSGEFEYLGRSDQQVKVRGFRIELGEIESSLSQHAAVRELVVEAPIDANGECRLVAYVTLKEPTSISNLRGFLKERLPEHMIPSAFVVLDRLPLTENGKLDRRALPRPGTARPSLDESYVAPRTVVEELLATIWADVLDLDRVGVEDNFFALGGDSIRSVQVLAQARERGLELSIQQLFRYQTIADLAREINVTEISDLSVTRTEPFDLISDSDRSRLPFGVVDAYPVTTLQGGMLYHMALSPDTAVYHNVNSWHLRAPFDFEHFKAAVARAVARHPIFRTSFDLTSYSEPMQLVHESATMQVDVTDLRHLSDEEQDEALDQFAAAERVNGFDLTRPPLLRFHLHRRTDESFQFTFTECHPILDGWSLNSTLSEIFTSYFSLMAGEVTPPEAPPTMTLRDFVAMERQALASEEHRAFWHETLRDLNVTRVPRLPAPYHNGDRQRIQQEHILLTQPVSAALHSAARALKVPLKSVLLAAHFKVLSVLSGETDVVTGVVVNGRPEVLDGEQVRGMFLNTIPYRVQIPNGSWADLIQATFKAEWELLPHRRYPLLALQREMGGQPLFDAQFNFVHFHVLQGILRSGEVEVLMEPRRRVIEEAHFPLTSAFGLDLFSEQIKLMLQYDTDELSQAQVQAIAGYYIEVFERIAKGTAERHDVDVPLTDNERRQVLIGWNETARDYPLHQCLHELFEAQAGRTPGAVAVVTDDQSFKYSELNGWANQVARHLRDLGVGPDARVAILLERSIEMVVGLLGILKAGGAYVPLDPDYPDERLRFMLDDCGATVLLTDARLVQTLPECSARVVCLDASNEDISRQSTENLDQGVSPDNLAYVIYTSGSTGQPKGAMVPHRGVVNCIDWMQETYKLTGEDRFLCKTSLNFDASVWEIFWPLTVGASVMVARHEGQRDAAYLTDSIVRHGITAAYFVPSMLALFIEEPRLAEASSLRKVICGGESLPAEVVQQFYQRVPHAELHHSYGPTETSIAAAEFVCSREGAWQVMPLGRPLGNNQLYILNKQMEPVPAGVTGELYIGGTGLARGYHGLPGLTAEKFIPNPFGETGSRLYRTGDLARYLPDGLLEFRGRTDSQIKLRGMRIELGEIEAALREHDNVDECVVLLRGEGLEAALVAYVIPSDETVETGPRVDELRAYLALRLPPHMVPATFVTLKQLPLMVNGKVDRHALPEPSNGGHAVKTTPFVAPANELERTIAGIWSEVLGREEIGTHDNFFDLGGHSLRLLLVHLKLRETIGLDMPMFELFQYPTVSKLAAHLQAGGNGESLDSSEQRGARRKQSVSQRRMQRGAARAEANERVVI
jgi:amino acid adenylation domain-containing protein